MSNQCPIVAAASPRYPHGRRRRMQTNENRSYHSPLTLRQSANTTGTRQSDAFISNFEREGANFPSNLPELNVSTPIQRHRQRYPRLPEEVMHHATETTHGPSRSFDSNEHHPIMMAAEPSRNGFSLNGHICQDCDQRWSEDGWTRNSGGCFQNSLIVEMNSGDIRGNDTGSHFASRQNQNNHHLTDIQHDPSNSKSTLTTSSIHDNDDLEERGTPMCKTNPIVDTLSFQWDVSDFRSLRTMAALKALPCKDRLISPRFGNQRAGFWYLALFPYADRETRRHVSLYLFSDDPFCRRVAEFRLVLLGQEGQEIDRTILEEKARVFTPERMASPQESPSWGWQEYLSVPNEEALQQYLHHENMLSVKVTMLVYSGIEEVYGVRPAMDVFYGLYDRDVNWDKKSHSDAHWDKKSLSEHWDNNTSSKQESPSCVINPTFLSYMLRLCPNALRQLTTYQAGSPGTRRYSYMLMPLEVQIRHNPRLRIGPLGTSDIECKKDGKKYGIFDMFESSDLGNSLQQLADKSLNGTTQQSFSDFEGSRNSLTPVSTTIDISEPNTPTNFVLTGCTSSLREDLTQFLRSNHPTARDLQLICIEGSAIPANRIILMSRSPIFRAMLSGKFRESIKQIDTVDVEASKSVLEAFVEFLEYDRCALTHPPFVATTLGYGSSERHSLGSETSLSNSIISSDKIEHLLQLWELSDFYLVPTLYRACVGSLARMISLTTATSIRQVALRLHCGALINATTYIIRRNIRNFDFSAQL